MPPDPALQEEPLGVRLLLGVLAGLLGLVSRLLGAIGGRRLLGTCRRLLERVAAVAAWALGLFLPGGFLLAHTVASRVRLLLEHSAALSLLEEEPLQHRLGALPPPVQAYLQYALAGADSGSGAPSSDYKLAHLKLSGHIRFARGSTVAAAAAGATPGRDWHRLTADCYLSPGGSSTSGSGSSGGGNGGPSYVLSATVQLGALSWVRGFASYLGGAAAAQWRLCSPFRTRNIDLSGRAGSGASMLGSAPLAAFLAVAPCCPFALLPSPYLRWRPLGELSAEVTVEDGSTAATAVCTFDRAGRLIRAVVAPSPPSASAAATAAAPSAAATAAQHLLSSRGSAGQGAAPQLPTSRGAGSLAAAPPRGGNGAGAAVWCYCQYERRCGCWVPTELEACWEEHQPLSFLHVDLAGLSAWTAHEMAPPQQPQPEPHHAHAA